MKRTKLLIVLLFIGIISFTGCIKNFDQPTIEVTGYTLKELPKENAFLDLDLKVTNNDKREALIKDVEYTAVIEGFTAQTENETINKDILVGTPLELTLPLTLKTSDAIQLLKKLDKGESLEYVVTGTFHVDEPIKNLFDLPINISGDAYVEVGFDDFFDQPEVTVNSISGSYTIGTSYVFDLDANTTIENIDDRDAVIDEIEYTVTTEGVKSSKHYYTDTYGADFSIAGLTSEDLTLPVTYNMNILDGANMAAGLADGTADYVIEGTFHVIQVNGEAADFLLPLYVKGSCSTSVISK